MLRHAPFFNECPNVASNEHYFSEWANWAIIQERVHTAQWDNHYTVIQVNDPGAGPSTLYTICNDRIEKKSPDARLHEGTGLTNELQRSADFDFEVGDPMDLGTLSAHAFPARMMARMRKRPLTTTPVEAYVAKKRKTFVTNEKGTVIAAGFPNEMPRQKTVYPKTAYASQTSSEQQIHGTNLTCILETGSEVNFLGDKHLKELKKNWHTLRSSGCRNTFGSERSFRLVIKVDQGDSHTIYLEANDIGRAGRV